MNIKKKTAGLLKAIPGSKTMKKEKRIIPITKTGGFLTLWFSILAALGALGDGAASIIAKAVNDAKANKEQLEEHKRQLWIVFKIPFSKKLTIKLPSHALTNLELAKFAFAKMT